MEWKKVVPLHENCDDMKKILIIDDERDICEILRFNLTANGYEAALAYSAAEALALHPEHFDLLLLDVMMPGMSGFELARQLRSEGLRIPIIFITARDSEDDTLQGFQLGADDYVAKPFSVREVLARVRAVLGRTTGTDTTSESGILRFERLVLNVADKTTTLDGEEIQLTRTEFELLHFFLTHRGQVFSRQELIALVWPSDVIVTDRTVDVNITRLRKKLGNMSYHLISRHGYGYLFK